MKDKKMFKSFKFEVKEINEEKREIVAIISKQVVDLDKDVVVLSGMTFKEKIPLLWAHQHSSPPIGEVMNLNVVNDELIAKLKYVEPEVYSFADTIYKLTVKGVINEFSIGFMPSWNDITYTQEIRYINKSTLFEVSSVNFGANPYTAVLSKAVKDGIIDEVEKDEAELYLKTLDLNDDKNDDSEFDEILNEIKSNITEDKTEQINKKKKRTCKTCGSDLICPICNEEHKSINDFEWIFSKLDIPSPTNKESDAESVLKSLGIK